MTRPDCVHPSGRCAKSPDECRDSCAAESSGTGGRMSQEDDGKRAIIKGFEDTFPGVVVKALDDTVIPAIPSAIKAFILTTEALDCRCTPRCVKEIIVLWHGLICAFVSEEHYHQLDRIAQEVMR